MPIGHVFQNLFGELLIFAIDLAVKQEADMLLYRLHDDLWLCGEPAKCARAWTTMENCAKVLGLEFNKSKTGSVYLVDEAERDLQVQDTLPNGKVILGFLELDAHNGNWIIDQTQVDAHVKQLGVQLSGCNSIFSWIQTWNSCIGRFFNYTFGQPANCFGRGHVDMVLAAHQKIQQTLFANEGSDSSAGSVTKHLQRVIADRFNQADVPEAFLYYPEQLGGLGVRNPFIPFLVVREQLMKSPGTRMAAFFEEERKHFKDAKARFDTLNERDRERRLESILGKFSNDSHFTSITNTRLNANQPGEPSWVGPQDTEFMTFEEYTCYREKISWGLREAYHDLLATPSTSDAQLSSDVIDDLSRLSRTQPELSQRKLSSDRRWLIQLYSKEAFRQFGSLGIVDHGLLPMGVMTLLRNRKVSWQTVL